MSPHYNVHFHNSKSKQWADLQGKFLDILQGCVFFFVFVFSLKCCPLGIVLPGSRVNIIHLNLVFLTIIYEHMSLKKIRIGLTALRSIVLWKQYQKVYLYVSDLKIDRVCYCIINYFLMLLYRLWRSKDQ